MSEPAVRYVADRREKCCTHGKPLHGSECRKCDIVWFTEGLKNARDRVARYEQKLRELGVSDP